jgi:hypothetical protein
MASAIEQVLDAFRTRFEAAGLNVEVDRDESDALQQEELESVAMSWLGSPMDQRDTGGTYYWSAEVAVDAWVKARTGQSVITGCNALLNTCARVIQENMELDNFGQLFHICKPMSMTGLEAIGADTGAMSMIISVSYQTLKGDWSTIYTG